MRRTRNAAVISASAALALALLLLLGAAQPLRLHVVANSDSAADQGAKLAVRDAVLAVMAEANVRSRAEAEAYVMENGARIVAAAEETLKSRGIDYGVTLRLGEAEFPDRVYGGEFYPAGEYRALRVMLGDAEGENWWCVLYPPLCLADVDADKPIKVRSALYDIYKLVFGAKEA